MAVQVARRMMEEGMVDCSAMERVVKITVTGPSAGTVRTPELVTMIRGICDGCAVEAIWKAGRANIYYVAFASEEAAGVLVESGMFMLSGNREARTMWYDRQEFVLRIHWLAPFVSDRFLYEVFSDYGAVRKISRDEIMVGEMAVETGVRRVKIMVTERQRRDLPHVINFADGHGILIVMPGRSPVCLGCGEVGHVRAYSGCPARVLRERSWAERVTGGGGGGIGGAGGVAGAAGRDTGSAGDVTGTAGSAGETDAVVDEVDGTGVDDAADSDGGDDDEVDESAVTGSAGESEEAVTSSAVDSGGGAVAMMSGDAGGEETTVVTIAEMAEVVAEVVGDGGARPKKSVTASGGAESGSWATAVEEDSVSDSQLMKVADSVLMEVETESVKRKKSDIESVGVDEKRESVKGGSPRGEKKKRKSGSVKGGSPRAEKEKRESVKGGDKEKEKEKSESVSVRPPQKCARMEEVDGVKQFMISSGDEVEKNADGSFKVHVEGGKLCEFDVAVCGRGVSGEVRVITVRGVMQVFSTEGEGESSEKVMENLYCVFASTVTVVVERKEARMEIKNKKDWKIICQSADVWVNVVKGNLFLMIWRKKWVHAVVLKKGNLSLMRDGFVRWKDEKMNDYRLFFEMKADARELEELVSAFLERP